MTNGVIHFLLFAACFLGLVVLALITMLLAWNAGRKDLKMGFSKTPATKIDRTIMYVISAIPAIGCIFLIKNIYLLMTV